MRHIFPSIKGNIYPVVLAISTHAGLSRMDIGRCIHLIITLLFGRNCKANHLFEQGETKKRTYQYRARILNELGHPLGKVWEIYHDPLSGVNSYLLTRNKLHILKNTMKSFFYDSYIWLITIDLSIHCCIINFNIVYIILTFVHFLNNMREFHIHKVL